MLREAERVYIINLPLVTREIHLVVNRTDASLEGSVDDFLNVSEGECWILMTEIALRCATWTSLNMEELVSPKLILC